jgi:hypothetical protein|tara:strand:+ start:398 stop:505 length:108 start_codon:yes stop_codon:yes gene_type:complete
MVVAKPMEAPVVAVVEVVLVVLVVTSGQGLHPLVR